MQLSEWGEEGPEEAELVAFGVGQDMPGALGELHALLAAQKITPVGPGGAIYANDVFTHGRRAYGSLATYVTNHALAVEGPIREYYVVSPHETNDENRWRTEIGWPVFHTGPTAPDPGKGLERSPRFVTGAPPSRRSRPGL